MKAHKLIPATMACILLLCGCGNSVSLSTEQNDLIAEYAAGTLLKHSNVNKWKYTKLNSNIIDYQGTTGKLGVGGSASGSTAATAGTTTTAGGSTGTTGKPQATGSMSDLAAALQIPSANITYVDYIVGSTYPKLEADEVGVTVRAQNNRDIVAVEFQINNPTNAPIVCNSADLNVVLKLGVNGSGSVSQYATLLKNDINALDEVTIAAGDHLNTVALFMVSKSNAENITGLSLTVNSGSDSSTIPLQ